jgi:hypothetical protein
MERWILPSAVMLYFSGGPTGSGAWWAPKAREEVLTAYDGVAAMAGAAAAAEMMGMAAYKLDKEEEGARDDDNRTCHWKKETEGKGDGTGEWRATPLKCAGHLPEERMVFLATRASMVVTDLGFRWKEYICTVV